MTTSHKIRHSPQWRGIILKTLARLCDAVGFSHACQYCVLPITLKPRTVGRFYQIPVLSKGGNPKKSPKSDLLHKIFKESNVWTLPHRKLSNNRKLSSYGLACLATRSAVRAAALTVIQLTKGSYIKTQLVWFWLRQSHSVIKPLPLPLKLFLNVGFWCPTEYGIPNVMCACVRACSAQLSLGSFLTNSSTKPNGKHSNTSVHTLLEELQHRAAPGTRIKLFRC